MRRALAATFSLAAASLVSSSAWAGIIGRSPYRLVEEKLTARLPRPVADNVRSVGLYWGFTPLRRLGRPYPSYAGSATVVHQDGESGVVLTAAHVADEVASYPEREVRFGADGDPHLIGAPIERILARSGVDALDYALVRVRLPKDASLPVAKLSVRPTHEVYGAGFDSLTKALLQHAADFDATPEDARLLAALNERGAPAGRLAMALSDPSLDAAARQRLLTALHGVQDSRLPRPKLYQEGHTLFGGQIPAGVSLRLMLTDLSGLAGGSGGGVFGEDHGITGVTVVSSQQSIHAAAVDHSDWKRALVTHSASGATSTRDIVRDLEGTRFDSDVKPAIDAILGAVQR